MLEHLLFDEVQDVGEYREGIGRSVVFHQDLEVSGGGGGGGGGGEGGEGKGEKGNGHSGCAQTDRQIESVG